MKRKPFEVTAALQAVGLQIQRRSAIPFVSRRPSSASTRTTRPTSTRISSASNHVSPSNMVTVTTVHLQANPYHLKQELINSVRDSALRGFLDKVLDDPMVESAMTTTIGKGDTNALYPIQYIQTAAHWCSNACVRSTQEKDIVFVATVIRGLTSSKSKGICCKPDHQECLRRVLSRRLGDLRDTAFAMGFTLEQLLQWSEGLDHDALIQDTRKQMDHYLATSLAQLEAKA